MGVRPPQQDNDDDVETVAFGIAALDEHLDRADVTFPTTASALVGRLDDPDIPYDAKGNEMSLSVVLEETHTGEFETRQDLLNALHPVFEAKRERANNTIIGQLRALLPF